MVEEASSGNLGRQFTPAVVRGDVEALRPERPETGPYNPRPYHEMTPEEFSQVPGTMFHGTFAEHVPYENANHLARIMGWARTSIGAAGIHVGTAIAAAERLRHLTRQQMGSKGNIFPVRFSEEANSADLAFHGIDRGDDWRFGKEFPPHEDDPTREGKIEEYINENENAGSTSWRVPRRSLLRTQGDYVREAAARGEWVHPLTALLAANPQDDRHFSKFQFSNIADRPTHVWPFD